MIGGMLAGWEHVQGVELNAEYAEIARHRLAFYAVDKPAEVPVGEDGLVQKRMF